MKYLSEADKRKARNQSIPRLHDLLQLAKKEHKFVIFDLYGPPPKHPLRNTFIERVTEVILNSNIEPHLVCLSQYLWWRLGSEYCVLRSTVVGLDLPWRSL